MGVGGGVCVCVYFGPVVALARARPLISHTIAARRDVTEEAHLARRFTGLVFIAGRWRGLPRRRFVMERQGAVCCGGGRQLGITQWFHNENILRDHVGIKRGDYSSECGFVFLPPLCVFLY